MHVAVLCVIALLAIVIAMLPAFGILFMFRSLLPEDPQGFLESIIYFIQTVAVWFLGFIAIFAYSDVAFSIVFVSFEHIFKWDKEKTATLIEKTIEKAENQQEVDRNQDSQEGSAQAEVKSKSD